MPYLCIVVQGITNWNNGKVILQHSHFLQMPFNTFAMDCSIEQLCNGDFTHAKITHID